MKITQFLWEKFGQIEKHYGERGAEKGFHALTFPSHFSSIHSGFVNSPPPQREIRKERQKARTISISHFFSLHIFKWMYKVWKEAKSLLQLQKWDLLFLGFDCWSLKTGKKKSKQQQQKQANKQTKQKGINCIQGSSDSKREIYHMPLGYALHLRTKRISTTLFGTADELCIAWKQQIEFHVS